MVSSVLSVSRHSIYLKLGTALVKFPRQIEGGFSTCLNQPSGFKREFKIEFSQQNYLKRSRVLVKKYSSIPFQSVHLRFTNIKLTKNLICSRLTAPA